MFLGCKGFFFVHFIYIHTQLYNKSTATEQSDLENNHKKQINPLNCYHFHIFLESVSD